MYHVASDFSNQWRGRLSITAATGHPNSAAATNYTTEDVSIQDDDLKKPLLCNGELCVCVLCVVWLYAFITHLYIISRKYEVQIEYVYRIYIIDNCNCILLSI